MTTVALADQHHCSRLNDACIHFIASLDAKGLDDVMASQGYADLKSTCPLTLVELWEKKGRLGK
jgi:speckle-type POZ protein